MNTVSASGSIQIAVQAVKQAIDQEVNIASLISQATPDGQSGDTDSSTAPPAQETGRGKIIDILA